MITGTHFSYFFICHRKLWLFANGINMEQTSETVSDGKLIHETTYGQRPDKFTEIEVSGVRIDYYDAKNKVIHETKRSDKMEEAHEWQVKFYIHKLEEHGVNGVTGILDYPAMRRTHKVQLDEADRIKLHTFMRDIEQIIYSDTCPSREKKTICKSCSYNDFCWSGEEVND